MDGLTKPSADVRQQEIGKVMDECGFDEIEIAEFVAMGLGEGDRRFDRPKATRLATRPRCVTGHT
jgi:hypothetical protein